MKALVNATVIAESDDTVVVEGNHYFPASSLSPEILSQSDLQTVCPWKGTASYYDLTVDGETYPNAIWYYASPKDAASEIADRVAFGRPVTVEG